MRIRRLVAASVAAIGIALSLGSTAPLARAGGSSGVGLVPDVGGKSRAEATEALTAEGYLVGVYEIAGDPPDTVAAQTPAAATALPRGGIVSIDVRRATPQPTPAPHAVGLTTAAAVAALGRLYDLAFEVGTGAATERGKVIQQIPAEGQPLALRGRLTLKYVSDPTLPATVALPDITGLTAVQSIEALGAVGLHGQIVEAQVPGAPVDLVIGEFPLPGSEVPRESNVRVIVTVAVEGDAATPAPTPVVPNLIGLSESAAKDALQTAGLDASIEYVTGDQTQAFLVVEQNPIAGANAAEGSAVMIRIVKYAAPPPQPTGVPMPNLIGMEAWQAEDVLSSIGLRANPILMDNPSVPPLRVFGQQVTFGTLVAAGSSVTYRVSRPPAPTTNVVVPNLYQSTVGSAVAACGQAGLGITIVEIPTNAYPAWRVFSQSQAAYTIVPAGTIVIARIAKPSGGGVGTAIVPDLTGRTAAQATALLLATGLGANTFEVWAPGKPPLKVFDQQPAAGSQVAIGTLVHAKVAKLSSGWKTVPALLGLTKAQAVALLSAHGLGSNPSDVAAPTKPVGKVFSQDAPAGSSMPAGSIVSFEVATAGVVPVPYLIGKTDGWASAKLVSVGLDWKRTYKVAPPGTPPGFIFEQSIVAGALVAPGTQVEYFLPGLPPAVAMIPNVVTKTKAVAIAMLNGAGFNWQVIEVVAPAPWGFVLSQFPAGNTGANLGTVVKIKVSKNGGLGMVGVPNLIGLTGPQANSALAAVGLGSNGSVVLNLAKPLNKVYSQNYIAGTLVPTGTVVKWKRNP